MKHHRGDPRGTKVWVVGIVERGTNRIKLFPVENRNADTLCRILERHVTPGSTIYSDGWAAYKEIGNMGYRHLFVEHKTTFKRTYVDQQTGEVEEVHTNTVEGADSPKTARTEVLFRPHMYY